MIYISKYFVVYNAKERKFKYRLQATILYPKERFFWIVTIKKNFKMKNSNLRNLVNKSKLAPIEGEMLKSIKGGLVAAPCKIKCGSNGSGTVRNQ